ncbi:hypothetical protein [Rhodococcus sp. DMU1]|uniref:hypothetical protein n=1 Tax=Rhodococcus sp. DMU1 TaxID=2722825 RepID=UPI00143EF146|nr:hypothetical protein [Rhodococcus sp. DMU1]QIX53530.1 hypothetical protein HFP48_28785 [Rhodococcus sp. DMU1]
MSTLQLDVLDHDPTAKAATLRTAYGCFPSGVIAICALQDREPIGITASSFLAVSMEPPDAATARPSDNSGAGSQTNPDAAATPLGYITPPLAGSSWRTSRTMPTS